MDRTRIASWLIVVALLGSLAALVVPQGWSLPVLAPAKPTAVTYFFPNRGSVPSAVAAGINELNTRGIIATTHEEGTTNAAGQVPKQYAVSYPAAQKEGLPCLVVMAGDSVLRIVKAPTTKEQVLEAAK